MSMPSTDAKVGAALTVNTKQRVQFFHLPIQSPRNVPTGTKEHEGYVQKMLGNMSHD